MRNRTGRSRLAMVLAVILLFGGIQIPIIAKASGVISYSNTEANVTVDGSRINLMDSANAGAEITNGSTISFWSNYTVEYTTILREMVDGGIMEKSYKLPVDSRLNIPTGSSTTITVVVDQGTTDEKTITVGSYEYKTVDGGCRNVYHL